MADENRARHLFVFDVATGGGICTRNVAGDANAEFPEGVAGIEIEQALYNVMHQDGPHRYRWDTEQGVHTKELVKIYTDRLTIAANDEDIATITATTQDKREVLFAVNARIVGSEGFDPETGESSLRIATSTAHLIRIGVAGPGPEGSGQIGDPWHYSCDRTDPDHPGGVVEIMAEPPAQPGT